MKKSQFFSHRPPSPITLLNDPWPTAPQVRNHRKTFEWPPYRGSQEFAQAHKTDTAGLKA